MLPQHHHETTCQERLIGTLLTLSAVDFATAFCCLTTPIPYSYTTEFIKLKLIDVPAALSIVFRYQVVSHCVTCGDVGIWHTSLDNR